MNAQMLLKVGTIGVTKLVGTAALQLTIDTMLRKIKALKDTPRLVDLVESWKEMTRKEKMTQVAKWLGVTVTAAFVSTVLIAAVVDALDESWVINPDEDVFASDFDTNVETIEEV